MHSCCLSLQPESMKIINYNLYKFTRARKQIQAARAAWLCSPRPSSPPGLELQLKPRPGGEASGQWFLWIFGHCFAQSHQLPNIMCFSSFYFNKCLFSILVSWDCGRPTNQRSLCKAPQALGFPLVSAVSPLIFRSQLFCHWDSGEDPSFRKAKLACTLSTSWVHSSLQLPSLLREGKGRGKRGNGASNAHS